MPTLRFARAETRLGPMWVAETDAGVAAVERSVSLEAFLAPLRRRFPRSEPIPGDLDLSWLTYAFSGEPLPPVDLHGLSLFDARVYEVVRAVPPGETITYGDVAALIGSPGAARRPCSSASSPATRRTSAAIRSSAPPAGCWTRPSRKRGSTAAGRT